MGSLEYPSSGTEETYRGWVVEEIKKVFDFIHSKNWEDLIDIIKENPNLVNNLVNCSKLVVDKNGPPSSLITPLHQAVEDKAPKEVIEKLLQLGASRSLKTVNGERAYDIGKRIGVSNDILSLIEVPKEISDNEEAIAKMEEGLHKVILGRVEDLVKENRLSLPQVGFLFEFGEFWYPVPGMYGGFNIYKVDKEIVSESWCRIAGGSGQRHLIDKEGNFKLTEEGFDC